MPWTTADGKAKEAPGIEWGTPQDLFDELNGELGPFTLDPCSTDENAKTEKHYTKETNGLVQTWAPEIVFMNPPYGREIKDWMRKARSEADAGATVICLVPCRPDTVWWRETCCRSEVWLRHGRIQFVGGYTQGPFPVAVVIMRPGDPPYGNQAGGWWKVRGQ